MARRSRNHCIAFVGGFLSSLGGLFSPPVLVMYWFSGTWNSGGPNTARLFCIDECLVDVRDLVASAAACIPPHCLFAHDVRGHAYGRLGECGAARRDAAGSEIKINLAMLCLTKKY